MKSKFDTRATFRHFEPPKTRIHLLNPNGEFTFCGLATHGSMDDDEFELKTLGSKNRVNCVECRELIEYAKQQS